MDHAVPQGMDQGMDRGVWIVCGFGALIHTLYFDSYPNMCMCMCMCMYMYMYMYMYICMYVYVYMYVYVCVCVELSVLMVVVGHPHLHDCSNRPSIHPSTHPSIHSFIAWDAPSKRSHQWWVINLKSGRHVARQKDCRGDAGSLGFVHCLSNTSMPTLISKYLSKIDDTMMRCQRKSFPVPSDFNAKVSEVDICANLSKSYMLHFRRFPNLGFRDFWYWKTVFRDSGIGVLFFPYRKTGFPNLGWVRKMEFHELALAFMKCRSAPDIGRVCVDAGNNGPSLKWQLVWARLLSSAW